MYTCTITGRSSGLADSINFIKYDDMEVTLITSCSLLIFSIGKQISHILLCLSNKLAQNFRSIHNLGISSIQQLSNLTGHKSLASTRRSV
uniref:Uncharacterized protein n=1 Tax=Arundo donax TaxID=35708 RepID=A0A0A9CNB8_ARUDO